MARTSRRGRPAADSTQTCAAVRRRRRARAGRAAAAGRRRGAASEAPAGLRIRSAGRKMAPPLPAAGEAQRQEAAAAARRRRRWRRRGGGARWHWPRRRRRGCRCGRHGRHRASRWHAPPVGRRARGRTRVAQAGLAGRDERPTSLSFPLLAYERADVHAERAQDPVRDAGAAYGHLTAQHVPNANDVAVGGAGGGSGGEGGEGGAAGAAVAALRGYSMVDPSPSPMPGAGGESPAMTWGAVLGTSRLGDAADVPGQEFKMPALPRNEAISHKLASDAGKRLRARTPGGSLPGGSTLGSTATRRRAAATPSPAHGGVGGSASPALSAARQRLASAIARGGGGGGLEAELRRRTRPRPRVAARRRRAAARRGRPQAPHA